MLSRRRPLAASLLLALALPGCPTPPAPPEDAAARDDAAMPHDAGRDAAATDDAGLDAFVPPDALVPIDVGNDAYVVDVGVDAALPPCVGPPGLYTGDDCTQLADGVRPYHPRYELWSDGNDKERFLYLPPGTQIDTSNPDRWGFPVGTRVYKTFLIAGERIETRILEKIAAPRAVESWTMTSWVWSADQRSVSLASPFGVRNVRGTGHDIPSRAECERCHTVAQDDTVNGFSAVQLAHDEGGVTLAMLNADGWLTAPIDPADAQIPGDATTSAALGYLHANCGNCHGGPAPEHGLDYWFRVGITDPTATPAYTTAVCGCSVWTTSVGGTLANLRIAPHHPEVSISTLRMQSRVATEQMPPIGSRIPDPDGIALVSAWITSLDETANGCPHGCPWP
ncbi:MAG: hypothetical protein U0234_16245 [Sandaracinus sp.]